MIHGEPHILSGDYVSWQKEGISRSRQVHAVSVQVPMRQTPPRAALIHQELRTGAKRVFQ